MAKTSTPILTRENMELAAQGLITTGTGLLTLCVLSAVKDIYLTPKPPEEEKKPKKKSIINAARNAVTRTFDEVKKHPALTALAMVETGGTYMSIETARHLYQELGVSVPLSPEARQARVMLSSFIRLAEYFIAGAVMLAAGWSLYLTLHPEILTTAITALGALGEKAIDEISQIIEGINSWVPDDLELSLV